ncbi:tyrosine-type recombinase/integrase [Stieleria sp. JC731]|uniref:tyrosine-type recombinase/integrase n=1 Tax=Pirellulaceae TaxID=2691357 RepID=UPI001E61D778|nr:tyrosine-type recombinase/integrase [Stieleria sp. JC731]MCC9602867.1 tyrosine-type recombinase/integrase [Stieleria sp. JC731]
MSHSSPQARNNWGDNVFKGIPVGSEVIPLANQFHQSTDYASDSLRAFGNDLRKFAKWFTDSNREPLNFERVTARDIADCREHLRRDLGQATATVNRCLVTLRRFFGWLAENGHLSNNPAKKVKQLRKQELAPKGLERSRVRKLLREVELRQDIRAQAIFNMLLFTGCRVSDLAGLELTDLMIGVRSGTAVFRQGKGNKQRSVPLPLPARQAIHAYLDTRPPVDSDRVFVGERGPLTSRGVRNLCDKYSAFCGFKIHPHLLRHTMAHQFLADNNNDLVSLAQILGHESLNTTSKYTLGSQKQLGEASDNLSY